MPSKAWPHRCSNLERPPPHAQCMRLDRSGRRHLRRKRRTLGAPCREARYGKHPWRRRAASPGLDCAAHAEWHLVPGAVGDEHRPRSRHHACHERATRTQERATSTADDRLRGQGGAAVSLMRLHPLAMWRRPVDAALRLHGRAAGAPASNGTCERHCASHKRLRRPASPVIASAAPP